MRNLLLLGLAFYSQVCFSINFKVIDHLSAGHTPLKSEISKEFNVLVWNIFKGDKAGWKKDLIKLSSNKEILLLQEGVDSKNFVEALDSIDFESKMAISWTSRKGIATGVITSSKIESINDFWQRSYYREPITKTPKMTYFTEYKIKDSNKTLLVVNIHAINFVPAYKLKDMLVKAVTAIKSHSQTNGGPCLFAGDFNTWTKKKVSILNRVLKNGGLKEASFSPDLRKRMLGKPLDYIWYKGMKLISSKAHGEINSSDHKPMSAKFLID